MYKRYGNKGITLIALVITIIVLLILAAVSIAMISGENSILNNARKAVKDKAISDVKEEVLLAITNAFTEYHAREAMKTLNGETLQDLTNDALIEVKNKNVNNADMTVEYNESNGEFSAIYKKEPSVTVLKGKLENGIFTWEIM